VIQNSGTVNSSAANSIIILFSVVIIDNGQYAGQTMWITVSAEYYSDTELWVGQGALPFIVSSPAVRINSNFLKDSLSIDM
jgi:hypothetical protein